ncbi:MAG: DUF2784 domain-containing protein [Pseudomonadota bacterium]|nr:DUF2784 domain-containing protein [Pseudomonadota bacterium]
MALIADAVLLAHFGVVVFITGGLVLVPVGYKLRWGWIGNRRLRYIHAGAMTFVALETLLGFTCPLTLIENYLSGRNTSESFIGYWVKRIFYYDFPVEYFAMLYVTCLAWTVAMWKLFPPRAGE